MGRTRFRYAIAALTLVAVFGIAFYFSTQETPTPAEQHLLWKSFDEGVAQARQSHKKILVDVYTDWCSWCKKMDSEVYTDQNIQKLLNDDFVAVKLNAESDRSLSYKGKSLRESELAQALGVTGYPTTVFFDEEANPITSVPGYSPAVDFKNVLSFIGQDHYKSTTYQEYLSRTASSR